VSDTSNLLEKNAQDVKGGARRAVLHAAGAHRGDRGLHQKRHLRFEALRGVEIVPGVSRLCAMNLYLHGIGPDGYGDHTPPITTDDALRDEPSVHAEVVVTNPPFGKKSSITVVNEEEGEADRQKLTCNRPEDLQRTPGFRESPE
jgi:type I restriction-modification system DNA methylase subunit